jgi:hypothetical protein
MTDSEYEKLHSDRKDALRPKLTPEFLAVLREAIRVYGYAGDWIATVDLGQWCYYLAGVPEPGPEDWEPFADPEAVDRGG